MTKASETPLPTGIEKIVCDDIASRQQAGIQKYGTTVRDNPLPLVEWLRHAYHETLDQAIYLRRAIDEIQRGDKVLEDCGLLAPEERQVCRWVFRDHKHGESQYESACGPFYIPPDRMVDKFCPVCGKPVRIEG